MARTLAAMVALSAWAAACSATARPIPEELSPLPGGRTEQIASAEDASAPVDAGRALAAHTDQPASGCVDAQKRQLRIRQAGADRYLVPREVINVVRSERKSTMTKQVDPTTGQQTGYSIVEVGDGSCLQALGFRNGDLVRTINGHDLVDWDAIRQAFSSMTKDGVAIVRLDRGGRALTLVYEFQN